MGPKHHNATTKMIAGKFQVPILPLLAADLLNICRPRSKKPISESLSFQLASHGASFKKSASYMQTNQQALVAFEISNQRVITLRNQSASHHALRHQSASNTELHVSNQQVPPFERTNSGVTAFSTQPTREPHTLLHQSASHPALDHQ